jgi:hypothetical protein
VHSSDFLGIALDPAPRDRSIIVGISVWTPCYFRPLPRRIEQNDELATLIASGIEILIVLGRELPIAEQRDGVTCSPGVKLDPVGEDVSRNIRVVPELDGQSFSREVPWRRRY